MNILTKATVLVLNRNWQAINVRTPQEAFCMMATNVATGLEIEGEDHIRPVTWEEWIKLPIRDQDEAVRTVRGQIRVPIRSIGRLNDDVNRKLSQQARKLLSDSLGISPDRVYLNFTDVEASNWGWNGSTFG
jgi:phenylpyruvate tautomerase PptA (4-oxalocrotonate tautomerase family)